MGKQEDEITKRLLANVDLNLDGFGCQGGSESSEDSGQPIQDVVFSDSGIRLLADIHEGSFAILIGVVENGNAVVSGIAEIAYRRDIADVYEQARGMIQINDESVRIIGLYQPGDDSERLASFLRGPLSVDFVMSGLMDEEDFCVNTGYQEVNTLSF